MQPALQCNTLPLQHTATPCNTLQLLLQSCQNNMIVLNRSLHVIPALQQHPETFCNTLQHPATPCNTRYFARMS